MKRTLGIALFAIAAAPLMLGADLAAAYAEQWLGVLRWRAFVSDWLAALGWLAAFGILGGLFSLAAERKTTAFFAVGLALAPVAIMAREHTPVIATAAAALAAVLAADVWRTIKT
jgi:hypothetical protein